MEIPLGGLIPLVSVERERHVLDGSTVTLGVTWLRMRLSVSLHTALGSLNPRFAPKWWRVW